MCCHSPVRARGPRRRARGTRAPGEHAARNAADAQAAGIAQAIRRAVEDSLRGAQAAAHGRADALAQVAGGKPGGIAGDESVVAPHDLDAAAQVVAVAGRLVARTGGQGAVELGGEVRPMRADILAAALHALGQRAHPDVEPAVLLGHVPRIARQAVLEEPQVAVRVTPVVFDLVLQRHDLPLAGARIQIAEQFAIYRAARATGADQVAAVVLIVDQVAPTGGGVDVAHVVLLDRGTGALQQPGIELEAADRVLHAAYRYAHPAELHAQARKRQQPVRIGRQVDLQLLHHLGRHPAGAQLDAREALAIEHQHVHTGGLELPGGARSRRTATDDEYVTAAHAAASARVQVRARPGDVVVLAGCEHHLEQLQRPGGEAGDRTG